MKDRLLGLIFVIIFSPNFGSDIRSGLLSGLFMTGAYIFGLWLADYSRGTK